MALELQQLDPSSPELLQRVLELSNTIFCATPDSKYASIAVWRERFSHTASVILYLSRPQTPDRPVAFLFAYPKTHVPALSGGESETLHIWLAGVIPERRKEGCLARMISALPSLSALTVCTRPADYPDMWNWLIKRGWTVERDMGGGKVMLSKRA